MTVVFAKFFYTAHLLVSSKKRLSFKQEEIVKISRLEANVLLYALDKHVDTDKDGNVAPKDRHGLTASQIQALRDRLFLSHDHPLEHDND